jgi:hypothetical protein
LKAAERMKALKDRAKREDLVILVWGPGDPGPGGSTEIKRYWEKRQQIRNILAATFTSSQVFFSEDKALRSRTQGLGDLLPEELVHAGIADCILILDVSRGAHVEVDHFSGYPSIANKMRILIPRRFVGGKGLVSAIHDKLKVHGFTDQQFDRCTLASKTCIDLVLAVAYEKLMRSGGLPMF